MRNLLNQLVVHLVQLNQTYDACTWDGNTKLSVRPDSAMLFDASIMATIWFLVSVLAVHHVTEKIQQQQQEVHY